MASRLFTSTLFHPRTPLFFAGIGVSSTLILTPLLHRNRLSRPFLLDSSPSSVNPKDWSFSQYQNDAKTPIVTRNGGLNARAVRQLSAGSITGLAAGLAISLFSKPLALLIGLLIVGVQTAENYGIRLVPYGFLQRYARSIDLRSAVQDNVAFKLSFGTMFALSAFAEF